MKLLFGILVDLLIGNPENFSNSIDIMKFIIEKEDQGIRKFLKNPIQLRLAGGLLALINMGLAYLTIKLIVKAFDFNVYLQLVVSIHLAYMAINWKEIAKDARQIKEDIKSSDQKGRARLSNFVSRDTQNLSKPGLIRATVESVAKRTCDCVIGPLSFMVFGIEFAYVYLVITLMDDAWGHKDEYYRDFGLFVAKLDDIVNIIPARLTALFMLLGSALRLNVSKASQVTIRDFQNHESPNAGWPQAAMAGLLGIELGGGAFYKGLYVDRPSMGIDVRPPRTKDIDDSIKISRRAMLTFALVYIIASLILKGVV